MSDDSVSMVVIARITTVYGVKGWVKIHSYTNPIENFIGYQDCYLDRGDQWDPIDFDTVKKHGKGLVALIDGVNDREQARTFCQCDIAISSGDFPDLNADEFYWHQLQGLEVYTEGAGHERLLLGKVDYVMETGANDVLVVRPSHPGITGKSDGAGDENESIDKAERLIPWIKDQVVKKVDIESGVILVDWDPDF